MPMFRWWILRQSTLLLHRTHVEPEKTGGVFSEPLVSVLQARTIFVVTAKKTSWNWRPCKPKIEWWILSLLGSFVCRLLVQTTGIDSVDFPTYIVLISPSRWITYVREVKVWEQLDKKVTVQVHLSIQTAVILLCIQLEWLWWEQ